MTTAEVMIPLSKARTDLRAHFGDVSSRAISEWVVRGKLDAKNDRVRLQAEKIGSQWFTRESWIADFTNRFPSLTSLTISEQDESDMAAHEQAQQRTAAAMNRIEEEDWETICAFSEPERMNNESH